MCFSYRAASSLCLSISWFKFLRGESLLGPLMAPLSPMGRRYRIQPIWDPPLARAILRGDLDVVRHCGPRTVTPPLPLHSFPPRPGLCTLSSCSDSTHPVHILLPHDKCSFSAAGASSPTLAITTDWASSMIYP